MTDDESLMIGGRPADAGVMGALPLPPPEPRTLADGPTVRGVDAAVGDATGSPVVADASTPIVGPEPGAGSVRNDAAADQHAPAADEWRPRLQPERRGRIRPRTVWFFGGASPRERRLGLRLDLEVSSIGTVLHGCRPGTGEQRIDHLVVVPSGVWVIIADHSSGSVRVERGDDAPRLTVGGVGAEDRLDVVARTRDLVSDVLVQIDMDWVEVNPALCFTNSRVRATTVDGVEVVSARRLVKEVTRRGPLLHADARRVAGAVGRALVVDGDPSRRASAPLRAVSDA